MFQLISLIVLFSLLSFSSATTFRSVNLYSDSDCSQSYDPRSVGATSSFTQWITLPSASITNITNQRCVVDPFIGQDEIGSAHYICQQSIDSTTGTKLQIVSISEYSDSQCQSTAVNFYSMIANTSSSTATFPLCLKTQYFNSRNRSDFYAKIDCANTITTSIVMSNSADIPSMIVDETVNTNSNGAENSFHLSLSVIFISLLINFLAASF